jgi:hypothetical protein
LNDKIGARVSDCRFCIVGRLKASADLWVAHSSKIGADWDRSGEQQNATDSSDPHSVPLRYTGRCTPNAIA